MRITKAVFTTIDDNEIEKITVISEYGPFDSTEEGPVGAFFKLLQDQHEKELEDELPEIIV